MERGYSFIVTKWLAIALSVVWIGALSPTRAAAQSSDTAAQQAQALHNRAVADLQQKKWTSAIGLWETAMTLHPTWKYAFNLAIVHDHLKQWLPAWRRCRHAQRLGIPKAHQGKAKEILKQAERQLLRDHALIELKVQPAGAAVTIEGKPWAAPYERWVKRTSSKLTIMHKGYRSASLSWDHPIGARLIRELSLVKEPVVVKERTTARITITVSPPEATIQIGKKSARGTISLDAKRHTKLVAHVRLKGYVPKDNPITVGATDQILDITLVPAEMTSRFATSKWVVLSAGVLTLGCGIGLLTYNESIILDDIIALNDLYSSQKNLDPADYNTEYDDLKGKYDGNQIIGWIMTGVGAAAGIAALVLFLMDEEVPKEGEPAKATWTPLVYPGGIGAQVRF
jgi:hypothetical protein